MQLRVIGTKFGLVAPLVPIESFRHGRRIVPAHTLGMHLVVDDSSHVDATDRASMKFFDAFANIGARSALRAMLHDAVVLLRGPDDQK